MEMARSTFSIETSLKMMYLLETPNSQRRSTYEVEHRIFILTRVKCGPYPLGRLKYPVILVFLTVNDCLSLRCPLWHTPRQNWSHFQARLCRTRPNWCLKCFPNSGFGYSECFTSGNESIWQKTRNNSVDVKTEPWQFAYGSNLF